MIPSLIIISLLAMMIPSQSQAAAHDLSIYQWKNRVVLIAAPNVQDNRYRAQAASFMSAYPELLERDLIVLTRFGEEGFKVTLIGKDGGVKLTRGEVLSSSELFAVIDAMPMRRAEMRNQ